MNSVSKGALMLDREFHRELSKAIKSALQKSNTDNSEKSKNPTIILPVKMSSSYNLDENIPEKNGDGWATWHC